MFGARSRAFAAYVGIASGLWIGPAIAWPFGNIVFPSVAKSSRDASAQALEGIKLAIGAMQAAELNGSGKASGSLLESAKNLIEAATKMEMIAADSDPELRAYFDQKVKEPPEDPEGSPQFFAFWRGITKTSGSSRLDLYKGFIWQTRDLGDRIKQLSVQSDHEIYKELVYWLHIYLRSGELIGRLIA